ncbi:MAG: glyoxalase [Acidobacteriota bacterium]|nr:glyoxalase [Acidobacteriota bacterium]
MKNRSAPPCGVIPVVAYPVVATAVAWLEAAFGFRVRLKVGDHRVQMWFESACLVVGEVGENREWATRSSTMLRVRDVDGFCARALIQGARILHAPQTHVYGERQATLEDFAGHIWTLTQTVEDVDPAVWGGEAVEL